MGMRELTDRPANLSLSAPEPLADGYLDYRRYRMMLMASDGTQTSQTRDVLHGGKVAAVLPIDVRRDEIVLIRQFRLPAHFATGHGEMIEIVAGRVEPGERPVDTARRECIEEIGLEPAALVELFSYLTTPGITDEEVTVFIADVDAAQAPARTSSGGEMIEVLRVPVDEALAALNGNRMRNGLLLTALQWLALNRERVAGLLSPGIGS